MALSPTQPDRVMDPARWEKIDKLIDEALELPAADRTRFVRDSCGADPDLAEEVLRLLSAQDESESFLEDSAIGIAARTIGDLDPDAITRSLIGRDIGGYRIERLIGSGGMGEVYLAYDEKLKRNIALKILAPLFGKSAEPVRRFRLEASAISSLNHPGIVTIHDVGEIEGTHFIATEHVDGRTLRQMIGSDLELSEILSIFIQFCSALAAAHSAGIVHRDIKPENLMVRDDGFAKILDFGLAKLMLEDPQTGDGGGTRSGLVVGTPAYMSPAQIEGKQIDHRVDLWGLAVVLYELITGTNPFRGESRRETFEAIAGRDPGPPRSFGNEVPADLDRILLKALEKDPAKGYQSADELRADLIALQADISPLSRRAEAAQRRYRYLPVLAGFAALLVAAGAAYIFWPNNRQHSTDWANAKNIQLTFESGTEYFPSISPDGGSFVYASDKDGDFDLYLRNIGDPDEINLTVDTEAHDTMPAFSPDGKQIAFRSERDKPGIYVMNADGSKQRMVADEGFDPDWSPDSKRIVAATLTQEIPAVRSPSSLFIIDLETGEKKTILDNYAHQPAWSPSGERIAFWYTENRGKRIVATVSSEGGDPTDFAFESNTNWNPAWSPDGEYLYYSSDRGGNMGFWRAKFNPSTGLADGEHESVPTPAKFNRHIDLSSDGKRLIYVQTSVRSNILTSSIAPRGGLTSEPKWLTRGDFEIAAPQMLPDGSGFVARLVRETQDDLVFVDGTTGAMKDLTNDAPFDRYSRVSPDGKTIVFASDRSGLYQIWLMNIDGTGVRQVTDTETIASIPAWSPDGKLLSYDSGEQVYVLDMERFAETGKAEVRMKLPRLEDGGFFRVWDWSPNGRFLAGNFSQAAGSGVGIYDLETGHYRRLTESTALPVWMPDGERLLFVNDGKPFFADIISGDVYEAFPEIEGYVRNIAVSPDGETVYYTLRESESNIWLLDAAEGHR